MNRILNVTIWLDFFWPGHRSGFFLGWHRFEEVASTFLHPSECSCGFEWGFQKPSQIPRTQDSRWQLGGEPHLTTGIELEHCGGFLTLLPHGGCGRTNTYRHWSEENKHQGFQHWWGKKVFFIFAGSIILVCYFSFNVSQQVVVLSLCYCYFLHTKNL